MFPYFFLYLLIQTWFLLSVIIFCKQDINFACPCLYIQMYRGNFPSGFPSQFSPNVGSAGPRPRFNYPPDRFPLPQRPQERDRVPEEEIITRPIIKEEDLTRMDDISRDAGWAAHDDIDYNQKLAFSDDEPEPEPPKKEEKQDVKVEEKLDENHSENKDKPRDNRDNRETVKDNRDQPTHRPWNQSTLSRDLRGPNGPNCFSQPSLQSVHSLRGLKLYFFFYSIRFMYFLISMLIIYICFGY